MNDVSYQMFETYYRRAVQADEEGRIAEARQMYLLASESLLKSARNVKGETKAALIRRADKLQRLADCLEAAPSARDVAVNGGGTKASHAERVSEKKQGDESNTIWRSEGKPNVGFDDIAGLHDVKESVRERVILPRQHPEVYKLFKHTVSGGILLYGPPGTGKTMIAKAIASEIDSEFYAIRCSDIVGKYFGEAEKNVKSLFETARKAESAVLFFDEFEALASQRGGHSTVMNRLVPELLSQMDGFAVSQENNLLILAATNRPWDIDSAFLRPPRLTQKIYVGLPDFDARLFLIRRAFEDVPCEADVSPEFIAEQSEGYNAADIVALCGSIKQSSIRRTIEEKQTSPICREDVEQGLVRVRSSVQKRDIEQIRKWEATQGV